MRSEKVKVLIIDDSKVMRELISGILSGDEFVPVLAPGPREGVTLAKLKRPDIILMDMDMPVMNGLEACALLKKIRQTQDIPVIFLTANNDEKFIEKAFASGGCDYVVKPFTPDILISCIRKTLD